MKPVLPLNGRRQSGAVLLVSLVLLVVMTLFALAAMNFTNTQARIAGNVQVRSELKAAAQQAVEQVISNFDPDDTSPVVVLSDVNGDNTNDYQVTVTKSCLSSITLSPDAPEADLLASTDNAACQISGAAQSTGIETATAGGSICASSLWDVSAVGTDAPSATFKSSASITAHQGIATRVFALTTC